MLQIHGKKFRRPLEKCHLCDKFYRDLPLHNKIIHENIKSHECDSCEKSFALKSYQDSSHKATHHKTERKFPCDLCEKCFKDQPGLNLHRKIVHDKIKKFQCAKCNKGFFQRANHDRHFQSIIYVTQW